MSENINTGGIHKKSSDQCNSQNSLFHRKFMIKNRNKTTFQIQHHTNYHGNQTDYLSGPSYYPHPKGEQMTPFPSGIMKGTGMRYDKKRHSL